MVQTVSQKPDRLLLAFHVNEIGTMFGTLVVDKPGVQLLRSGWQVHFERHLLGIRRNVHLPGEIPNRDFGLDRVDRFAGCLSKRLGARDGLASGQGCIDWLVDLSGPASQFDRVRTGGGHLHVPVPGVGRAVEGPPNVRLVPGCRSRRDPVVGS